MKKSLIIISFLAFSLVAKADVIYFPYQYSLINYSVELIYEYEMIRSPQNTFVYWGGAGLVGSFFYLDEPDGVSLEIDIRDFQVNDLLAIR